MAVSVLTLQSHTPATIPSDILYRRTPLYGAYDHRNPCAARKSLLRRSAGGSRREAHGRLHLQPGPRLVCPDRRRRAAPLSRADEGRRHRPDPPRGRQTLAPHLVRQPHGVGTRHGGQPCERFDHQSARRPERDARRARDGAQGRPLHPRKPRSEGPLHGAGGRDTAKHLRRNPHRAGDGGEYNIEMK